MKDIIVNFAETQKTAKMISNALTTEIIENLNFLGKVEQNKVLKFVKALVEKKETEKADYLKYFGSIDKDDMEIIEKVIKEDCERIDHNEW